MSEQNNLPCALAQDLMPLVIDGAASEESRKAVTQHTAACPVCRQVYLEMQSAAPAPIAQEKTEQGFRQAVKRQRKRFRAWKIAALCLGLVVILCLGTVIAKPSLLLGIEQAVPVSWLQNPQLVRTTQGALLLQFTPAPQYKQHYGWRYIHYSGNNSQDGMVFSWRYPWIEQVLGRTLTDESQLSPTRVLKMADGRWADLDMLRSYRYQDGKFYEMRLTPMTAADFSALEQKGDSSSDAIAMWRQCEYDIQYSAVTMQSGSQKRCIYSAQDGEIPLCDAETQAAFDAFVAAYPGYYHWDGDLESNRDVYLPWLSGAESIHD